MKNFLRGEKTLISFGSTQKLRHDKVFSLLQFLH